MHSKLMKNMHSGPRQEAQIQYISDEKEHMKPKGSAKIDIESSGISLKFFHIKL